MSDDSHAYNRLCGLLGRQRAKRQPGVWSDRMNAAVADLPAAAELTFRIIRSMADRATAAGARFLLAVHPDEFAFKHRSSCCGSSAARPCWTGFPFSSWVSAIASRGWTGARCRSTSPAT